MVDYGQPHGNWLRNESILHGGKRNGLAEGMPEQNEKSSGNALVNEHIGPGHDD